ncbi:MAG: serine hydrolase [Chitinophagia bacterium]
MKQPIFKRNFNSCTLHRFFLVVLLASGSLFAYPQNTIIGLGALKPYKTISTIKIDGVLDEPIWEKASITDKLFNKQDSIQTYDNTKSYFTYDADNLYIAFKCKVKNTALLSKIKLNKDDQAILKNEWVAFAIDTYNDGIIAYTFFVDVAGNQFDGTLNASKDLSNSFSSNWTSAIQQSLDGYTIEMKIPLITLPVRWNKNGVEMKMLMIRFDKQNNQEIQSPFLDPTEKNKLTHFQKIILHGIHATHPKYLSGVNILERLAYKKSKIDITTLEGRSKGGDASVMDYAIFKKREIDGANKPRMFHYSIQSKSITKAFESTDFLNKYYTENVDFNTLLERSQTTAFLVLQNDTIVYEKYFNGFYRNSIFTSFSIAKSFVSILIGLAIADGYIKSDTDKITTYLPELLKKDIRFSTITISDLVSMRSGLSYSEAGEPSDDDFTYVDPNLRKITIENVRIAEAPGKHWLYNNYNPLLLGLILERTTHKSVSKYLEERLWKKMGGGNASWSLDENGFEKMESGINCSAIDFARFAELLLNNGRYNNIQVVPEDWVQKATQPLSMEQNLNHNVYYSHFWWGKLRGNQEKSNDFFGMGNKGEYVYVCPQKKLIIIRLGLEYGLTTPGAYSWPDLFYQYATDFRTDQ